MTDIYKLEERFRVGYPIFYHKLMTFQPTSNGALGTWDGW